MNKDFYKFFVRRYDYYFYKRYKSELSHIKEAKLKLLIQDNVNVDNRRKGLAEYIEKRKKEILKFDFESLISFKEKGNYYRFEDAFEHFTFSKFCKHSLTYDEENQVRNIIKLMDLCYNGIAHFLCLNIDNVVQTIDCIYLLFF